MSIERTVAEIARHVGGSVSGNPQLVIRGVSTPADAGPDDLAYIESPRHLASARGAGAVLAPTGLDVPSPLTSITVADPAAAMARVIEWLLPRSRTFVGVSPSAHVEADVVLGDDAGIGPFVYIGAGTRIGARTEVHPSSTIGRDCVIGDDCVIHAGVHLYAGTIIGHGVVLHSGVVIGADGFGYTREPIGDPGRPDEPMRHRKTRQVGRVIVADDVEIGANTTIDRASLSATRIGRGTKIDNLVQIGHNARIGRHCIIIGQAGISGSTVLGDYVTVAGQAGLAGHVTIGDRVVIGAQSGVTKDVRAGEIVLGSPAVESIRAKKALSLIDSLPEFKRRLAAHERRLAALERRETGSDGDA
jgi:UDP-3-O-[3-hydroxymyristoyl] glucosamine N-acyltransferase